MESSPQKSKRLSVVFSFRNEEAVLPELIKRVRSVLRKEEAKGTIASHELIFVNDASTDHSLPVLLEEAKALPDIRVINMSRPFGVSPCVMAGLKYASGDAVVYMDADLQDPPEVIPQLLAAWQTQDHVDVVHTIRRSRQGEPAAKLFLTKLGYMLINKFSSLQVPFEAGDFKLLSRRAVAHLLQLNENRPFMRGLVCWIGFKQLSVAYDRAPRFAGTTKFKIYSWGVIKNFFGSALIAFSSAPLKIATLLGLLALVVDFGLLIHVILEKVQGKAIPGWTAIMIAILFMNGVQLMTIGIMGLYINSIHEQSKNRPNYIIESMFGFCDEPQAAIIRTAEHSNFPLTPAAPS